jgi:hypothetical protein
MTYLILGEIIREVCNHDLVLGWNAVGWRTTLATNLTTRWASFGLLVGLLSLLARCLVCGLGQGKDLLVSRSLHTFLVTGLGDISW